MKALEQFTPYTSFRSDRLLWNIIRRLMGTTLTRSDVMRQALIEKAERDGILAECEKEASEETLPVVDNVSLV